MQLATGWLADASSPWNGAANGLGLMAAAGARGSSHQREQFRPRPCHRSRESLTNSCMRSDTLPAELQEWLTARTRHHLSHAHVQMARELGMNPRKLGKLDNHRQEPWKAPLRLFIEHLYFRRFGRQRPDAVLSIEERAAVQRAKKAARKEARRRARAESRSPDGGGQ